jgi:hypothetical protein
MTCPIDGGRGSLRAHRDQAGWHLAPAQRKKRSHFVLAHFPRPRYSGWHFEVAARPLLAELI